MESSTIDDRQAEWNKRFSGGFSIPAPTGHKQLLCITRDNPWSRRGGSHAYSHDVLAYLSSQGFEVSMLWLDPELLSHRWGRVPSRIPGSSLHLICPGYFRRRNYYWHPGSLLRAFRRKVGARLPRLQPRAVPPVPLGTPLSTAEAAWVGKAARQQKWDAVVCSYCWLAEGLDRFGPRTRKLILTHDVWHQHLYRASDNAHLRDLDRRTETGYLSHADLVIAITGRDAEVFQEMLPQKRIVVAPMSCSPRFSDVEPAAHRLLFVGSSYRANAEGLKWFLREVAPILEDRKPGAFTLSAVGEVCRDLGQNGYAIRVLKKGVLAALEPEYEQAQVVLLPLLSGTGLKIKLVDALAHGKAVVTTPAGAQGVESLSDRAFVLAKSPAQFAQGVLSLSEDAGTRISLEREARRAAVRFFSPEACYRELVSELNNGA